MIAYKMKDIRYVTCRKKTEKENKIFLCIVIIEMHFDNRNVM